MDRPNAAPKMVRETQDVAHTKKHEEADLSRLSPMRPWYAPFKRGVDCGLGLFLIILSAPLVILAGLLIKFTSRGPVFYRQVRLGMHGRPFQLIKLRTMKNNAEAETGPAWSTANDSRVTAVGHFLRQTHLDEFPQLWNVLRGEMSLIGPRPERPEFVERLEKQVRFYRERMSVRPGITGLAQLRLPPDSNLDSVRRKVVHDIYYVRFAGPVLDFKLFFLTGVRLLREIGHVCWSAIVLPSADDVEEGFLQAVRLHSSAPIPLGVTELSTSTTEADVEPNLVEMHASAE